MSIVRTDRVEVVHKQETGAPNNNWLEIVEKTVRSTPFGSIHLKIHDGRIVEIEATRKYRPKAGVDKPMHFADPHERE